jgi:hypothetical protein
MHKSVHVCMQCSVENCNITIAAEDLTRCNCFNNVISPTVRAAAVNLQGMHCYAANVLQAAERGSQKHDPHQVNSVDGTPGQQVGTLPMAHAGYVTA